MRGKSTKPHSSFSRTGSRIFDEKRDEKIESRPRQKNQDSDLIDLDDLERVNQERLRRLTELERGKFLDF